MSKQRISDSPETLDYLLNEKIPISDRLAEYNKYDSLAFITSPGMLYPNFSKLICDNEEHKQAFWIEKQKAVNVIQENQRTLDYEAFVKYLFTEIGVFDNRRTIPGTKENNWQKTVIYDISPTNGQQAEILERVSLDYAKSKKESAFKKPSRLGNKNLYVPLISLDRLKTDLHESLMQPYADQNQVIADYRKQYLEPLQDMETQSTAQTIYKNFKTGKTDNYKGNDYFYYNTKGAVIELLKFEKYLEQNKVLEQQKETDNKTQTIPQEPNSIKEIRTIPNITTYANALDNEAFKSLLEPFKPDGSPRNGYYATIIDNWVEVRKKGLTDSNTFQERTQWLCDFLEIHCARLLTHAVIISKYANLYYYSNDPKHKGKFEGEYLKLFRFLKTFDTLCISLELNRNANVGLAIDMQGYCINRINELIGRLEKDFFINIQRNPIVIHFKEVKDKIENCIDIEKERFINEKQLFKNVEGNKLDKSEKYKPQQTNEFSVLEWATIFYYADETKLLPKDKFVKSRIEQFMDAHKIPTTFNSFKNNYHTAKNRINKNNDYPIDKLELILPFLEKNYKQAVTLIIRDIDFLLSEKSEYQ